MFALRRTLLSPALCKGLLRYPQQATVLNPQRYLSSEDVPSMETALAMPISAKDMDNSTLVTLGSLGHHGANKEILRRHIMVTDGCDYETSFKKYCIISERNKKNLYLLTLPYHIGMGVALTAGMLALPMVFHLPTAEWFNSHFVTTSVPEPEDLETIWETGSWTWNWM